MRVAAVQLLSSADPAQNLAQVASGTAEAARAGADLVVFPEATMRCFGRSLTEIAEPLDGPWARGVAAIAAEHDVVVAVGMFTPTPDGRVTNTVYVVGRGVEDRYDKIHLFDAFGFAESDTVAPGEALLVLTVAGVEVGFATCYDVRFPNLFTQLADRGAQVVVLPTSWGAGPGKLEQWRVLTRARALDSTTYVVAAAQADPASAGVPVGGSAPTGIGHSVAVSPTGVVIAELGAEPGLLLADIDPAVVTSARATLPVLANRRL
ncbi:carbon-nitrogen hydrolase family protein [Microlunatus ginsengisoli]|uniref:Carbon-nitrogen hydrolase family protein n=1 Tax=Microlunatus ginsengisoli TaxID=363863 RepID=A0ABP7ATN7_9ACTN